MNRERTEREKICIGGGGGKERRKCKQGLGGREKGVDSFSSHSPSSSPPLFSPKSGRTDLSEGSHFKAACDFSDGR